jgi:hypothetical protein
MLSVTHLGKRVALFKRQHLDVHLQVFQPLDATTNGLVIRAGRPERRSFRVCPSPSPLKPARAEQEVNQTLPTLLRLQLLHALRDSLLTLTHEARVISAS